MNNLPLLTSIPVHMRTWGTGPMSQVKETDERNGAGLEVLDLGSCSLSSSVLEEFTKKDWSNLRSITLHHNPLALKNPEFATKLQESTKTLPKLQIIDTKRVVERRRKGEPGMTKKDKKKRDKKSGPSGTNNILQRKNREWGAPNGEESGEASSDAEVAPKASVSEKGQKGDRKDRQRGDDSYKAGEKRKKRDRDEDEPCTTRESNAKRSKASKPGPSLSKPKALPHPDAKPHQSAHTSRPSKTPAQPAQPDAIDAARKADPSTLAASTKKSSKNETSVVGVIDVVPGQLSEALDSDKVGGKRGKKDRKEKRDKEKKEKEKVSKKESGVVAASTESSSAATKGGVDLKALFSKADESSGFGVGGW